MSLRGRLLCLCALLPALSSGPAVADEPKPDKELAALESRLQSERAAAIHARLVLYSDELKKLEAEYSAAGIAGASAAVQEEMKTVEVAMKRLTSIAAGKVEPAEQGELKPKEVLNDTALAARRIDAIIAQFSPARNEVPAAPDTALLSAQPSRRVLKMEKAGKNREHSKIEGSAYWAYDNSYAVWSPDDLVPGEYKIELRYTGSRCGGKATVRIGKQSFEVTVPEKGQGKSDSITAGPVKITERGTDIRVESNGRAKGADYLWNLQSLALLPVVKHP